MPSPPRPVIVAANALALSSDVNTNTNAIRTLIGLLGPIFFEAPLCPPPLSTTQRDGLTGLRQGAIIRNTTTRRWEGYDGSKWVELGGTASGGLAAVVTDNTLTGDGTAGSPLSVVSGPGGGLASVASDSSLTGNGTGANPLAVANPWDGVIVDSTLTGNGNTTPLGVAKPWAGVRTDSSLTGNGDTTDLAVAKPWRGASTDTTITGDGDASPLSVAEPWNGVTSDGSLTGDGKTTELSVTNEFTQADEDKLDSIPFQAELYDVPSTTLTTQGQTFVSSPISIDQSLLDARIAGQSIEVRATGTARHNVNQVGVHNATVKLEVISTDEGTVYASDSETVAAGNPAPRQRFQAAATLGSSVSQVRVRWTYVVVDPGTPIECSDVDVYFSIASTASGGATTFDALTDTPSAKVANRFVKTNDDADNFIYTRPQDTEVVVDSSRFTGNLDDATGTTVGAMLDAIDDLELGGGSSGSSGNVIATGTVSTTAHAAVGQALDITWTIGSEATSYVSIDTTQFTDNRRLSVDTKMIPDNVIGYWVRLKTGTTTKTLQDQQNYLFSFESTTGGFLTSRLYANTTRYATHRDTREPGSVNHIIYFEADSTTAYPANIEIEIVEMVAGGGGGGSASAGSPSSRGDRIAIATLPTTANTLNSPVLAPWALGSTVSAYAIALTGQVTIHTRFMPEDMIGFWVFARTGTTTKTVRFVGNHTFSSEHRATAAEERMPVFLGSGRTIYLQHGTQRSGNSEFLITLYPDNTAAYAANTEIEIVAMVIGGGGSSDGGSTSTLSATDIRDELQTLRGDERLDYTAVEGRLHTTLPDVSQAIYSPGDEFALDGDANNPAGLYKVVGANQQSNTRSLTSWTPARLTATTSGFDLRAHAVHRGGQRPAGAPTTWMGWVYDADADEVTEYWSIDAGSHIVTQIGTLTLTETQINHGGNGLDWIYRAQVSSSPWTVGTPVASFTKHTQAGTPFTNVTKHASLLHPFAVPTYQLPRKVREAGEIVDDREWADVANVATEPKVFISSNTAYTASNITGLNYQHSQTSPVNVTGEFVAVAVPIALAGSLDDYRLISDVNGYDTLEYGATSVTRTATTIYFQYADVDINANRPVRMQKGTPLRIKSSALPPIDTRTPRRVTALTQLTEEGEEGYLTADYNRNHVDISPTTFRNTFLDGEGYGTRGYKKLDASNAAIGSMTGSFPALELLSDTRLALAAGSPAATKVVVNGSDYTAARVGTQDIRLTGFAHEPLVTLYAISTLPAGDWDEVQVFAGSVNLTPTSLVRRGHYAVVNGDPVGYLENAQEMDDNRDFKLFGVQAETQSEAPKSVTFTAGTPARVAYPFTDISRVTFQYTTSRADTYRYGVEMPANLARGQHVPVLITVGTTIVASAARRYALSPTASATAGTARFQTEQVISADRLTASSLTKYIDVQFADGTWANGVSDERPVTAHAHDIRATAMGHDQVYTLPDRPTDHLIVDLLEADTIPGRGVLTAASQSGVFVGFSSSVGSLTGAPANGITRLGAHLTSNIAALNDTIAVHTTGAKLPNNLIINDVELPLTRLPSPYRSYFRTAPNNAYRIQPGAHYRVQIEFADNTQLYADETFQPGTLTYEDARWQEWDSPTHDSIDARIADWAETSDTTDIPLGKLPVIFETEAQYAARGSNLPANTIIFTH